MWRKKFPVVLAAFIIAAVGLACLSPTGTVTPTPPAEQASLPRESDRFSKAADEHAVSLSITPLADLVDVALQAPSGVESAAAVPLRLKVKNSSDIPITLGVGVDRVRYDFIVTSEDGTAVWRLSKHGGGASPLLLQLLTLQPGEVNEYEWYWAQRYNCTSVTFGEPCSGDIVPPGTYLVQGSFKASLFNASLSGRPEETVETEPQKLVIKP